MCRAQRRGHRGFKDSTRKLDNVTSAWLTTTCSSTAPEQRLTGTKTPAGNKQLSCLPPSLLRGRSLQQSSLESSDSAEHADQQNHSERSQRSDVSQKNQPFIDFGNGQVVAPVFLLAICDVEEALQLLPARLAELQWPTCQCCSDPLPRRAR